jgi:hypothetical protein
MAKKSRPTFQKRQKEQARQHKQQAKAVRRLQAKQRRANAASERDEAPLVDMAGRQAASQPLPAPNNEGSA